MISLSDREKKLLTVLVIFVGVLLVYFAVISPIVAFKSNLKSEYNSNLQRLSSLDKLYEEYLQLKEEKKNYHNLLRSNEGVTTLIENIAKQTNILKNKVYTRDNPSNIQGKFKKVSTEVKFESVDAGSIMKFIYKLENSNKIIKIAYMRVRLALKGKDVYDVTLKIDSYTSLE
jgi:type II secretory pathway component PulM